MTEAPGGPSNVQRSAGSGRLELAASAQQVTLLAGGKASLDISVRNTAGAPLAVDLAVRGLPAAWAALAPPALLLPPATSLQAALSLSPGPSAPPGSYPFVVAAQDRDDPSLSVRLGLVLEIGEPGELTVELVPPEATGQASAAFEVRVTQSGPPARVRLSVEGGGDCRFTFAPEILAAATGAPAVARLTVTPSQPVTGTETRTFAFAVVATPLGGGGPGRAEGRFVQRRTPAVRVGLTPTEASGPAGATFRVQVSNPSQVEAAVRLSASDVAAGCRYDLSPARLVAAPGATAEATLTVVPVAYHTDPGQVTHEFTVRAEPESGLLAAVQARGRYLQTAMWGAQLALRPATVESSGRGTFVLEVANPRPTAAEVDLHPLSADGRCTLEATPSHLSLAAGSEMTARLIATPTQPLLRGEPRRVCAFTVAADTGDMSEPTTVQGALVQVRGFNVLKLAFVLFVITAVALLVAGGIYVVRRITAAPPPLPSGPSAAQMTADVRQLHAGATGTADAQARATARAAAATGTAEAISAAKTAQVVSATGTAIAVVAAQQRAQATAMAGTVTALAAQQAAQAAQQAAQATQQAIQAAQQAADLAAQQAALQAAVAKMTAEAAANPPSQVIYDFVARAAQAYWSTGAGQIPFNGSDGDNRGFAVFRQNAAMEDGSTAAGALQTHPQWVDGGIIQGTYTEPYYQGYVVAGNDTFVARVGLMKGAGAGDVRFKVYIRPEGGGIEILNVREVYDGAVTVLAVPLGGWAGKRADFILEVGTNGSSQQDWATWVVARVYRGKPPADLMR